MTPPQKPEWMELADADSAPTVKKTTRLMPALIASFALAIVGVGAVATQISDEPSASANEQVAPIQSSSPAPQGQAAPTLKSSTNASSNISKTPVATPAQPSIASLPKGGGDDEGRESHDDREGDDD